MVTPANRVIARAGFTLCGPQALGDFHNIFLPILGEDQKTSNHLSAGLLAGTVLYYGKSGSDYCITFIKRLDEGLRQQLLGQKLSISPGLLI